MAFTNLIRGLGRRIGKYSLGALPTRDRAEVLQRVSDKMVVECPVPAGVLRLYSPAPMLLWRAGGLLTKEPDTIAWIDSIGAGESFWDIGANVGTFSLYAALHGKGPVLAFEPSAANYHVLAKNVDLNGLGERMTPYCLAFADKTRLGTLNLASYELGSSLTQFGQRGDRSRFWAEVPCRAGHGMIAFAIDDFVAQFNPPFPSHIKIDVDGIELPILAGARRTLADPRLKSILVELSLSDLEEHRTAVELLESVGFRLKSQGGMQGVNGEKAANHLFVRD
jgi:FkbM family methyltransferase